MRYGGFLPAELFDSLPNSIPLGSTKVKSVELRFVRNGFALICRFEDG